MSRALVLRADARSLPLPDASVDLVVTSPPYWGIRSYDDDGQPLRGQIGSEETPQEWLEVMIACAREWVRVLKPEGSMFINLGDKYDSGTIAPRVNPGTVKDGQGKGWHQAAPRVTTGRPKSLLGLPWRYAFACMDELGLILRAEIIWSKVNQLPDSAGDRVRRSHEQVFHFTRLPSYYSAVDEIRVPHTGGSHVARLDKGTSPKAVKLEATGDHGHRNSNTDPELFDPRGKLPGSVWEIAAEPLYLPDWLGTDHFAAYPTALVRPVILGWSPPGICTACGQGRRPLADKQLEVQDRGAIGSRGEKWDPADSSLGVRTRPIQAYGRSVVAITGYACACTPFTEGAEICPSCNCPVPGIRVNQAVPDHLPLLRSRGSRDAGCPRCGSPPTRPSLVVDPFGGTGTTALVAAAFGRIGISFDLSAGYCRAARWRTSDAAERMRALGQPKPPLQRRVRADLYGSAMDELDDLLAADGYE